MESWLGRLWLCMMLLLPLPQPCQDQEVPGSRPHQARDVRLWESAFCLASAPEPQASSQTRATQELFYRGRDGSISASKHRAGL